MGRAPYQHFGAPTTMYREMGTQLWLEKAEAKLQLLG